jgi:hypothetical protein
MRFAKGVFFAAGIWGLLVIAPLYFMYDVIGRAYPPGVTHPDFYYGFLIVTVAWQVAFLVIATDPVRFRPFMIAAAVEKFGYMATLSTLFVQGRAQAGQLAVVSPDVVLGILFVAAFVKTPDRLLRTDVVRK